MNEVDLSKLAALIEKYGIENVLSGMQALCSAKQSYFILTGDDKTAALWDHYKDKIGLSLNNINRCSHEYV